MSKLLEEPASLLRQPAFVNLRKENPESVRVVGKLEGADEIMHQGLFLGTYPGLTQTMLNFELDIIHQFVQSKY